MSRRFQIALVCFIGLVLNSVCGFSQSIDSTTFKIYLIGDAGEGDSSGSTLRDLGIKLQQNPNSAVIFLGDNCYKKAMYGLVSLEIKGFDGGKITKARMMSQLDILRRYNGIAYMIPGNHDWWNLMSVKKGAKHLMKEQLFVEDTLKSFTTIQNYNTGTFLPTNGSAGPVSREVNNGRIRLIFIDSHRLMIEESQKKPDTIFLQSFYSELESQLTNATARHQRIVVLMHHPIHSEGKHSQPMRAVEKLGDRFGSSNSNFPPYRRMTENINQLLKKYNRGETYFASGHEHSLEYFHRDSIHYIVSGAGSKIDKVNFTSRKTETDCVQWNEAGFFEIEFRSDTVKVLMYHRADEKSELKEIIVNE